MYSFLILNTPANSAVLEANNYIQVTTDNIPAVCRIYPEDLTFIHSEARITNTWILPNFSQKILDQINTLLSLGLDDIMITEILQEEA